MTEHGNGEIGTCATCEGTGHVEREREDGYLYDACCPACNSDDWYDAHYRGGPADDHPDRIVGKTRRFQYGGGPVQ